MTIFDTDILIWVQRKNPKAAKWVEKAEHRAISVQTYMELLQCATAPSQHQLIRDFLVAFRFQTLPFTENIGHRAAVYLEEYACHAGIRAGDAIIAATSVEHNALLITGNKKHFKCIKEIKTQYFTP